LNNNPPSGRRGYLLGLGAAINAVAFAMSTACMPVLFSEISKELGLDIVQIGMVWGFGSVAAIFSILLSGFLADRFGAKKVLTIGCLLAGIFGALRGFSDDFVSLTVTSLLFGLVSEALPVIVIKNTSLWFYGKGLGTAQGIITACVGGGMLVGSMISATVLSPWLGGWRNVLFFWGALSFLLGVLWFLSSPEPRKSEPANRSLFSLDALKYVLRRRNVWLIALAMMVFAGSNKGVMGYLPLYLRNAGWADAGADGALAVLNAAGMLAAIPFTLLSDRLGMRKKLVITGILFSSFGIGMLAVFTNPAVWPAVVLAGLFRDVIWAMSSTMIVETEGIGPAYAGTAVGIVHSFTRIGYTLAPPAGNSLVYFHSGFPFLFWAVLSLVALAGFSFVRETRTPKPAQLKAGPAR
jgi:NNP family nitrate/nitrite transporter-like MFS transporter